MSSALINHSPDLRRLQNEGYEIEIRGAYLVVSHVPYVTAERKVAYGSLVSELTLAGDRTARPSTHVIYFDGTQPCHRDGSPIRGILHGEAVQQLAPGLTVTRSFSNKPPEGYTDYHHKIARYVEILALPAAAIDPAARAQTYRPVTSDEPQSPLAYLDTNASRGHIQAIAARLQGHKIGIVGLGGTGSYVLDLVAKTPVAEIRLFDGDRFLQHNAFRAPGAAPLDELRSCPTKVEYLSGIYSRMHRGIQPYSRHLTAEDLSSLAGLNFVFLCLDVGPVKRAIAEFLVEQKTSFIDTGLGVQTTEDRLLGLVRVTTATPAKHDHLERRISFAEGVDDAYSTNIQIADLNMLNAALAVIKWKKLAGFYLDLEHEHHTTYTLDGNMLLNEEIYP
jgi:hypothetical protein